MRLPALPIASELGQQGEVSGDERFLLRARPAFQLLLGGKRLGHPLEPLGIDQRDGVTRLRIAVDDAGIVLADTALDGTARAADVVVAIVAAYGGDGGARHSEAFLAV